MKINLQTLMAVSLFIATMAAAGPVPGGSPSGGGGGAAPIDPSTGLPETPLAIDPTTGLPINGAFKDSDGQPTWINPAWADPVKALSSVKFENLPVSEVVRYLREQYTNDFDIILPSSYQPADQAESQDPGTYIINLQLSHVLVSEIFRAMNMQFELENAPLRWELTMNGSRPTILLRVVTAFLPAPPPTDRKIFFVGNLIQAENSGATNGNQTYSYITDTIQRVWDTTGISGGKVEIYPPAQLLIVSGTPDQVSMAQTTLDALRQKAQFDNSKAASKSQPAQ